jgi:hypothetical protein
MQIGRLRSSFASVLAFAHMRGMYGYGRRHAPRATAKPILIEEPSMTAEQMGITYESSPELYRAIHLIFGGWQ